MNDHVYLIHTLWVISLGTLSNTLNQVPQTSLWAKKWCTACFCKYCFIENPSTLVCLQTVYGCFATGAELNNCDRACMVCKAKNSYYLVLYRKFAFLALNQWASNINVHEKLSDSLLKHSFLNPDFTDHASVGWNGVHEHRFLTSPQAAGLWTEPWEPLL